MLICVHGRVVSYIYLSLTMLKNAGHINVYESFFYDHAADGAATVCPPVVCPPVVW